MSTIHHAKNRRFIVMALGASVFVACTARVANAEFLPVYSGPGLPAPVTGAVGYVATPLDEFVWVNEAGTAVASPLKGVFEFGGLTTQGSRAVRWSASGTPTELGNLGTSALGTNVYASAINDNGTSVGYAEKYDAFGRFLYRAAARWDAAGTAATELSYPGTDPSGIASREASAINDAGTIVGQAQRYAGLGAPLGTRAVRWNTSGAATELGHLGTDGDGWTNSNASAVNAAGTAVGFAVKLGRLGQRAVRWNAGATAATELGHLGTRPDGYTDTGAFAINDAGIAIGFADKYDAAGNYLGRRAVRWDAMGTAATELNYRGTSPGSSYRDTGAKAITTAGVIIGGATEYDDAAGVGLGYRAIKWYAPGTEAVQLGNLGMAANGITLSTASAINDAGTIVGRAMKYDDSGSELGWRAVYYADDGAAVDLNTLIDPASGWLLMEAASISNTGWIAGRGLFDPNGPGGEDAYNRHFLMQVPATVPEPASFTLLVCALVAALAVRRAKKRA